MFFFSKYDHEVVRVFQIREHQAKFVKLGRYVIQAAKLNRSSNFIGVSFIMLVTPNNHHGQNGEQRRQSPLSNSFIDLSV